MVPLRGTKPGLLQKDSSSDMVLTMKISLVLLSNQPLFVYCCLWLLHKDDIFVNLIYRTLFYMVFLKRRYLCGSLQGLRIQPMLHIFVILIRLSMALNRLLVLGMLG
jgi:hypothetical protein